ncbi:MAG: transcription-repair coupling factor [gamma proteobacterium endosymbiont of Lamellibrachia anaximandri]|nr:transcription-repair coupling factor [gamma proteobacterium endosymbiont of Lamellibrachia anaximandri]MBL3532865.1 transcription-repair coupling factor [gamma proteobacterium endosymbiont of Lamellibrachia anaximandri]
MPTTQDNSHALFNPALPAKPSEQLQWGQLYGGSSALAIANAAQAFNGVVLVAVDTEQRAAQLEAELGFFLGGDKLPVLSFPDWETLPYDLFSPLPELISQRLLTLSRLPQMERCILLVPIATLMQRLSPKAFLDHHSLLVDLGQQLNLDETRQRLERSGYQCVSQVLAHGEFAVRGSLLDVFPMGNPVPFRIDLFDDEVDSIRTFDPETQRSLEKINQIRMLPAREFPLDEAGISLFRRNYRNQFEGDLQRSLIYSDVSDGQVPSGLEYYLPLFFETTNTLFDYLPENHLLIQTEDIRQQADSFFEQVKGRYDERKHDLERPLLPPGKIYLSTDELVSRMKSPAGVSVQKHEISSRRKGYAGFANFATQLPPPLGIQARAQRPAALLQEFLSSNDGNTLFVAESAGRREMLLGTLRDFGIKPTVVDGWQSFIDEKPPVALTVAPIEQGLWLQESGITLITETQLYGEQVRQTRRRQKATRDPDQIVRNLTELHIGAPVVHEDHGVGRYLGLQTIEVGGLATEFLTLEYAKGDKLYVPVASLHLISRYAGASPDNAPLHRLGGEQWEKTKRKAAKQVRDVAAELLEIYARRAARRGVAFPEPADEYQSFSATFEFETTPDQQQTIDSVLEDMASLQPMDRVVCGDVGFGKTEVAMRAAFMATQGNKQVVVLVPTTLLAQQHYQNFADRFADWPVKVESLSRFRTGKQQQKVIDGLADGTLDIVVGTHKLLSEGIKFKELGLVIIDEEHRFGVRHKEKLKALRSEVDLLTLTATPIPRTLNMAMAGMRDLSIIATPPALRHPIKTFVSQWSDTLITEACQRELKRGGQIYFLHNEVSTIENMAERLEGLLPGIRLQVAHGQMRERELEGIMRDFYHQRFNLLVCTTIIESGIDVPTANTMIINRADKLGLAQLHQIRGRVGRSHHRAYAYLLTPPSGVMTADAKKRLEAIESLEDLGAGFTLSTHDMEIRGAGELLGDEQSGQINEIGFTLYSELLERAVKALKAGEQPTLDRPLDHGTEIELGITALLPEDYLPDVHSRLVLYKRIASAATHDELRELQVEMIDRFGLLPLTAKNLFAITELKLRAHPLGIRKIEAGPKGARMLFDSDPKIDPANLIRLIQTRPQMYKMDGGDKLRYIQDMPDPTERVNEIDVLIDRLIS